MVLPEVMAKIPLSSLRSKDLYNALRQKLAIGVVFPVKLERRSNPFRHRKYFTASLWHKCGEVGYRWGYHARRKEAVRSVVSILTKLRRS